jgi:hypothetical protein
LAVQSRIHLAFRFHVNFYHSYRGDSLDDRGIGKDIRIIRRILDDLDAAEAEGMVLRCAWDIENYYSLELYLPRHAPDILERIRERVDRGLDEIELMSWNNGLVTAHDKEDFAGAIARAISNPAGSGVADLFPSWVPIVRPQECMFTSAHIEAYRALGVEALSVYYSAIPFNGFGSFVPLLPPERRYNPLTLVDRESGAKMRLLPAANHADIVERRASLRGWLRAMRREQAALAEPCDFLLVIDMDADDSFWGGWLPSSFAGLFPSACGLLSLAQSLRGLPWLSFTRPWDYLLDHPDKGEISLGQDLADGAWDGYSSWAEKAENAELWTKIARAKRLDEIAQRIEGEVPAPDAGTAAASEREAAAGAALEARLLAMSTTHFGMASPVMNAERLADAFRRADAALETSLRRLDLALSLPGRKEAWRLDPALDSLPMGRGCIATLRGGRPGEAHRAVDGAFDQDAAGSEEKRVVMNPSGSRLEVIKATDLGGRLEVGTGRLANEAMELVALPEGGLLVLAGGRPLFEAPLSRPWIDYGGRLCHSRPTAAPVSRFLVPGKVAELRLEGELPLPGGERARWQHVYTLAAGLDSVAVDVSMAYPATRHRRFDKAKAGRLARSWDGRWRSVAPFELVPKLGASLSSPARVWKHGYFDRVSSYELEYHRFGPNREQDSLDNHVTDGWLAVAGGGRGLLVAQSAAASTLFAFCPMRTRIKGTRQLLSLNPFGSYAGRQWRYPAAVTGLGRLAAILAADNLDPYAPSWEGHSIRFSLMLAPFAGDEPPRGLQRDALVFATPPEFA